MVAEAELPPDEALSALSDPQALAIMVNASPKAIRTRRFRRMVPSKCVCEVSVSDVEKGEHARRETGVTPVTALTVRYGTVFSSRRQGLDPDSERSIPSGKCSGEMWVNPGRQNRTRSPRPVATVGHGIG